MLIRVAPMGENSVVLVNVYTQQGRVVLNSASFKVGQVWNLNAVNF